MKNETICPMCRRLDEDCGHLFFKCQGVKGVWRLLEMEHIRTLLVECKSAKETIKEIWKMDEDTQQKVWVLLWRWWLARNKVNAGDKRLSAQEISSLVTFFVADFEKLRKKETEKGQKKRTQMRTSTTWIL